MAIGFAVTAGWFTFLVQFGMAYLALRAESGGASEEDERTSPLLNLNLGWSF
jgi:hypothetical protein